MYVRTRSAARKDITCLVGDFLLDRGALFVLAFKDGRGIPGEVLDSVERGLAALG